MIAIAAALGQVSQGHTEQSWDPNPRSAQHKTHCKSCFATPWIPKESPATLSSWQVCGRGVGEGPESGAPHPWLLAPPQTEVTPSIHRNMLLPHKPTPAHWPHRCSPTQTFKGTRGLRMVCSSQLSDREQAQRRAGYLNLSPTADESPQPGA